MYRTALRTLALVIMTAALTAPAAASPSDDGARGPKAAKRTTLTMRVHGCDGCLVQPVQAGDGSTAAVWTGTKKKVKQGLVHWSITRRHTVAMSFNIEDPNAVNVGAMPNIVIAYRGIKVGHPVRNGVAAHKRWANGCWAGTSRASVTLRVRVEQFPATSAFPPPVKGYSIRPYLIHSKPHLRIRPGVPYTRTFHGQIGNQDAYFCGS